MRSNLTPRMREIADAFHTSATNPSALDTGYAPTHCDVRYVDHSDYVTESLARSSTLAQDICPDCEYLVNFCRCLEVL